MQSPGAYQLKVVVNGIESGFSQVITIKNVDPTISSVLQNIFQYIVIYGLVVILAATNMPHSEPIWSVLGLIFCGSGIYLTFVTKHTTIYLILMVGIYCATAAFLIFIFVFSLIPFCIETRSHFSLRDMSFVKYTKKIFVRNPDKPQVILAILIIKGSRGRYYPNCGPN